VTGEIDDSELSGEEGGEPEELSEDSAGQSSSERWSVSDSLVLEAEECNITDSTVLVPAASLYPTDDRISYSGEIFDEEDPAAQSIVVPSYRAPDESGQERRSAEDERTSSVDVEIVSNGPGPLQRAFDALKRAFTEQHRGLGVCDFQISSRSGRCLASTISRQERREMIAAFTAQAIQFASSTEDGLFAQLAAGDLQLLVLELPRHRLLTSLFDYPPDLEAFRQIVADATAEAD